MALAHRPSTGRGIHVLRDETRFQIAVPAGHDRVRVEATSAGGRVEALGSRNGAALALVIGS